MNREQVNKVYDILVVRCGAPSDEQARAQFVAAMGDGSIPPPEYRFSGALGFGGKLHIGSFNKEGYPVWVSCYKEDETPERLHLIQLANFAFAELYIADLRNPVRAPAFRKLFKQRLQYFLKRQRADEIATEGVGGLLDPELDFLLREAENL